MGNFNLAEYETVDARIKKFYDDYPTGRITTDALPPEGDFGSTRWIVKASVYRSPGYDAPDSTGYAFEIDGQGGMANKTSALENCETSAIGRALANIGYSGAKRPSQEEMRKTVDAPEDSAAFDVLVTEWVDALNAAKSLDELQAHWEKAGAAGVTAVARVIAAKDAQKKALA